MKGRIEGVALDRKLTVFGDIILQGKSQNALKKSLKIPGREGAQLHQNSCTAAQRDVQPGNVSIGAGTVDASILRADIFQLQALHFICNKAFKTKQAWNSQDHADTVLSSYFI